MNAANKVAITSVILYVFLFALSSSHLIYHAYLMAEGHGGKLSRIKLLFFISLTTSAVCSLPFWVLCLIHDGPHECFWNGKDFEIVWIIRVLALAGYALCVGVPSIIWSDLVSNRFDATHYSLNLKNLDSTRKFFLFFFISYLSLECGTAISAIIWMHSNDTESFFANNLVYRISLCLEPAIICMFTIGCLAGGIKLQMYVMSTTLEDHIQRKLLWQLNIVLTIVTLTYSTRAFLVFNLLFQFIPTHNIPFSVHIACTQWLPQILCSSCLLFIMSRASSPASHPSYRLGSVSRKDAAHYSGVRRTVQINDSKQSSKSSRLEGSNSTSADLANMPLLHDVESRGLVGAAYPGTDSRGGDSHHPTEDSVLLDLTHNDMLRAGLLQHEGNDDDSSGADEFSSSFYSNSIHQEDITSEYSDTFHDNFETF